MARTGVLKQAVQVQLGEEQLRSTADVLEAMANEPSDGVVLAFQDGRRVPLPASLVDVMRASARGLSGRNCKRFNREGHIIPNPEASRQRVDDMFHSDMIVDCDGRASTLRPTCEGRAEPYYALVRQFGSI